VGLGEGPMVSTGGVAKKPQVIIGHELVQNKRNLGNELRFRRKVAFFLPDFLSSDRNRLA
jgi:hypothetical protein